MVANTTPWLGILALLGACRKPPAAETLFAAHRHLIPRVSVEQNWEPCADPVGVGEELSGSCLGEAAARRTSLTPPNDQGLEPGARQHGLGLWQLALYPSENALGGALESLAQAARLRPDDADIANDLGVAELLAAADSEPRRFAAALAELERALDLEPDHPQARFNLALTLGLLGLTTDAEREWDRFLELEPTDSPWLGEAQARRRDLQTAAAKLDGETSLRTSYSLVLAAITHDWPAAVAGGDVGRAEEILAEATSVAERLTAAGDRLASGLVARAAAATPENRLATAQSLGFLDRLQRAIEDSAPGRVKELLARELPALESSDHPLVYEGIYAGAWAAFASGGYDRAADLLDDLLSRLEPTSFRALTSKARFLRALTDASRGRQGPAVELLEAAVREFPPYGPAEDLAFGHVLLGESYDTLEDSRSAWKHFYAAARWIRRSANLRRRVQILNSLADFTLRHGHLRLSYRYQNESVKAARALGNQSYLADVLLWRSLLGQRLDRIDQARSDLMEAEQAVQAIDDADRRRLQLADVRLLRGFLALGSDPASAQRELTAALRAYEAERHWANLALASEARAAASRALGDRASEQVDLERSWKLYEQIGWAGLHEGFRLALGNRLDSTLDQVIRNLVEDGKSEAAFVYYLRGRVMTQPAPLSSPTSTAKPRQWLPMIQAALPAGAVMIATSVLIDQTLLWEISSDRFVLHRSSLGREAIEQLVDQLSDPLRPAAARREASERLFEALVSPWLDRERQRTLLVVPDKALFRLPYPLLRDPETGQLFIESLRIAVSPSPQWLLYRRDGERPTGATREHALFVADPAFARREFPGLSRLPGAAAGVGELASLFDGARVLSGAEATVEAFRHALPEARMLDFSGHAVASSSSPLDSFLLFAPSAEKQSGLLTGRQLLEMPLEHLRLVSLSACRTGAALPDQWEGALQLARPFLRAGVPAVVATLWNVDDADASRWAELFYRQLAAGADPLAAVQAAQLLALRTWQPPQQGPPQWAAFAFFGVPESLEEDSTWRN
jgi:CHAT domain-containing protein